ncbi:MAG TPA: FAD-binding oxidoreductase [Streptosporangiaceae bacterium]|nr:FAD-binding oxidoreductase [Streptosporangiaceae bacterium]
MTGASVPGALARACRAVRPAGPRDAVAGVMPAWVASPDSADEASALLAAATEHELAVVPRGSGTRIAWGAPPSRCDLVLDTLRLDRVLEHAAGDLVVRVQAGVTMRRLAEVLAAAGQQLALDEPAGPPNGARVALPNGARAGSPTVGGMLATGAAGPRRLRYGTPRDLVIGITVVRSDGTVAKSGGKVVKNVAGYDLGKLYAGSYGTLGLITEATFRLHPLPAATGFVTAGYAGTPAATRAVAAAAASDLAPAAIEIDRPGRDAMVRVAVLLEGDPAGVSERAAQMRGVLGAGTATSDTAPPWWGAVSPGEHTGSPAERTVIRISFWAGALPGVLDAIDTSASAAGLDPAVAGSAAAGVLHAVLGAGAAPDAVAQFLADLREALAGLEPGFAGGEGPPARASAVVVSAPAAVRDIVDVWGPVPALSLMRALKDQFDPGHVMSPGRFAGGI